MGYCPFESRYKELYRDTAVLGAGDWATTRPATPTTRPREATTQSAVRKGVQQRARARPGWWSVSLYKVLHRDRSEGLAAGGCVTIQSLYRDRRTVWLARRVTIQTIVS